MQSKKVGIEQMVVLLQSIFISNIIPTSSHLHPNHTNRGRRPKNLIVSKKDEQQAKRKLDKIQQGGGPNFPIKKILAQVGIGVLSLGFIDAGGDWSRIGVISKENEDLLKAAAFVVVLIYVYLIYLISQKLDEK